MSETKGCNCTGGPRLVFACSGAADVGALADQAARKMSRDGSGKMFCMAGIGGRVSGIMKTTEAADAILAIDGCPLNCVKDSLENAGFTNYQHLQLNDMGYIKGKTPLSDEAISAVADKGAQMLARS